MNFYKAKKFLLILLLRIFQKLYMFPPFPCLGTILAPSCPAGCQPSPSPPLLSVSVVAVSFHLFSRSTTAPMPFCAPDPAPSPSKSGPGTRSSPSAASRPAWLQTPSRAARVAASDCRVRAKAVLPQPSGSHFQTRYCLHHPLRRPPKQSRNCFPTRRGGFCTPGTGGVFTVSTEVVPVPSTGTATEIRPLTSSPSSRGQSSGEPCGDLPTPLVDGQTSWVYPSIPIQSLYVSGYITVNKLLLL
jgi:hypothetical protein